MTTQSSTADDAPRISYEELARRLEEIFIEEGVLQSAAEILARNCAMCERDGSHSHGVFRVSGYRNSLRSGWVDGRAQARILKVSGSFIRIDAANGFAQPALSAAKDVIQSMIGEAGVALISIANSHHFSALWPDVEPFAVSGLIALTFVTGGLSVMPPGASKRLLGTNPFAFAVPVAGSRPLVMDFATSAMSNGDLRIASQEGRRVPFGVGVKLDGSPTDDPGEIVDAGGILPFGGHKGLGLSLVVEILASALSGGAFSHEVDFSGHPGAETPCTGQCLIVIDPARGAKHPFSARVALLLDLLRAEGVERLPGDRRYEHRDKNSRLGIPITSDVRAVLNC